MEAWGRCDYILGCCGGARLFVTSWWTWRASERTSWHGWANSLKFSRSSIGQILVVTEEWLRVGSCTNRNVIPRDIAARLLVMRKKNFEETLGDEVHYPNGPRMVRVRDKHSNKHEKAEHSKKQGVLDVSSQTTKEDEDIAHDKIAMMNLIKTLFRDQYRKAQADSLTIEDISSTDFLQSFPGAVTVSSICMVCVLLKNFSRYVRVFVFVFV